MKRLTIIPLTKGAIVDSAKTRRVSTKPYWLEGDIEMTMQVALNYQGKIILASDKMNMYKESVPVGQTALTKFNQSTKITRWNDILISEAGDGVLSGKAVEMIIQGLDNGSFVVGDDGKYNVPMFRRKLIRIADCCYENIPSNSDASSALMLIDPHQAQPIWKINVKNNAEADSCCDIGIAGSESNIAIFWTQYVMDQIPDNATCNIETVAATTILCASKFNPRGISGTKENGLEMWKFEHGIWTQFQEEELAIIRKRFNEFEGGFMQHFTKPSS